MAAIISDIDIARPPGEVFSYFTGLSRFAEWQAGVVSGHNEGDDAPAPGTRSVVTGTSADRTGHSPQRSPRSTAA